MYETFFFFPQKNEYIYQSALPLSGFQFCEFCDLMLSFLLFDLQ